jgi:SAM-dependent methyltransferase
MQRRHIERDKYFKEQEITTRKYVLPFIRELIEIKEETSVLEIGCGEGGNLKPFLDIGCNRIIGIDMSAKYIEQAKALVPSATFLLQDMQHGLPNTQKTNVIIASLSMHYMPWEDTIKMISRVRDSLAGDGLFLCRVNSVNDINYGAVGNPEVDRHYYLVDGKPKRFFDENHARQLFDTGWKIISLEEHTIDRFEKPKVVWEVIAVRK